MKKQIKQSLVMTLLLSATLASTLMASPTKQELLAQKKIVGYYPEWGIYSGHENYVPADIPFEKLTHVNYAFARIINGEINVFDEWAATGVTLGESWDSEYKGVLGQFKKLKASHPDTSFIISVGGWTLSAAFHDVAATEVARDKFASSCVDFMRRWNFDGVDIDWEFPTSKRQPDKIDNANDTGTPKADASEKQTFTLLMKTLREHLDAAGQEDGRYYQLTAAVGASKAAINNTEPAKYAQYLDFINIMTYDMHGAWEDKTNHQSPLYANDGLSISDAVNVFKAKGVNTHKLVIGSPYYSRGWKGVENNAPDASLPGLYSSATGGANGIWDGGRAAGVNPYYYVKAQMESSSDFIKYRDTLTKMPYLYSPSKKEMYTYEDEISLHEKTSYVNDKDLGGIIFWELTADFPIKGDTLTSVIYNDFYPNGRDAYANEDVVTVVIPAVEPPVTTPSSYDEIIQWDAIRIYEQGDKAIYDGVLWESLWWNQNTQPGSTQWGAWKNLTEVAITPEQPIDEVIDTIIDGEPTTNEGSIEGDVTVVPEVIVPPTVEVIKNGEAPSFDTGRVYTKGMQISYEGIVYEAQWWTKGEAPGESMWGPWREVEVYNGGNTAEVPARNVGAWAAATIYFEGELALYNNHVYEAQWWSRGEKPGMKWGAWKDLGIADATQDNADQSFIDDNSDPIAPIDSGDDIVVVIPVEDVDDTDYTQNYSNNGFFAPFVDATAWPPFDFASATQVSGNKNYALGFVVAKSSQKCEASWGTYYDVVEHEINMQDKIKAIQVSGGRAIVSFGGAANVPLAASCQSVSSLTAEYQHVVDTLNLMEIDFDIEGAYSRDSISIERRSKAIKFLQDANPELKVWFTLAVLPSGITEAAGMSILRNALAEGVVIEGVNIMAMDYGEFAAPNPDGRMGAYAIEAATSLHGQLQSIYGSKKTASELWAMIGITPMIGMNDVTTEVFKLSDAQEVVTFAEQKGIRMLSMWSANRDKECSNGASSYVSISCSSVAQDNFGFSKIFNQQNH